MDLIMFRLAAQHIAYIMTKHGEAVARAWFVDVMTGDQFSDEYRAAVATAFGM